MAQLENKINSYIFPHEVSILKIRGEASETTADISIYVGFNHTYNAQLTFDGKKEIVFDNLDELLRSWIIEDPQPVIIKLNGVIVANFVCLCAYVDLTCSALEFTSKNFLNRLEGVKQTSAESTEYLSYFSQPLERHVEYHLTKYTKGRFTSFIYEEDIPYADIYGLLFFRISVEKLNEVCGGGLCSFTVNVGERYQNFMVMERLQGCECVYFINSFGQPETFHFREVEHKYVSKRVSARTSSDLLSLEKERYTSHRGRSFYLLPGEIGCFKDLISCPYLYFGSPLEKGHVTGSDFIWSSSNYQPIEGMVQYRNSNKVETFSKLRSMPVNTFDNTFDNTFR